MPNSTGGLFPDNGGSYRTYTNAVFVNNTIIFPTYREEYDTTAFRIWGEVCPGYTLVGIDCDNNGNNIISQSGAIHCITHTIGVEDPLLISHQPLDDTYDDVNPYQVSAYMNHRDGITSGTLYWRISGQSNFTEVLMASAGSNNWQANIPAQPVGTIIEYYVGGSATTGKTQVRPLPAPTSFWSFEVLGDPTNTVELNTVQISKVFPNPAGAITCVEINSKVIDHATIVLMDMTGRTVQNIYSGQLRTGTSKYFFDASQMEAGVYQLMITHKNGYHSTSVMVK